MITAYDIQRRCAKFFTQIDARNDPAQDFLVRQVARATSAAPSYFEVALARSSTKVDYPLIDGGVFANNPAMCAYAEARHKLPGLPSAENMAILSLGTGYVKKPYQYTTAKGGVPKVGGKRSGRTAAW
jgi:patatin-like phospholipase/acyl hydrolase